jgi:ribosomal protein S19E (S16A)
VASIPDNWWFTRMSAAARSAFTQGQVPNLNVARIGLAPLTVPQVGWLTDAQVQSVTYQSFQYLQPGQIPHLTAAQVASIPDNWWFTRMSAAARGEFTQGQVPSLNVARIGLAPLTTQQVGWLTDAQVQSVTYQSFQYLQPGQIPHLTAAQVASIPDNWWFTRISAAARGAFTQSQVSSLNVAKIGLSPLTAQQIGWLTDAQVQSVTYRDFQYLWTSQIPMLTGAQIGTIPDDWWFSRITAEGRAALTTAQIQQLNTARVSIGYLIPRQQQLLTEDQIRALGYRDFRHLSSDQVKHLTPAQMATVPHADHLRKMKDDAEAALSRVQLLSLQPQVTAQMMGMSPVLAADDPHHGSGSSAGPHPDDPEKRAEHEAVFALVPHAAATHRTIASGNWSDAAIWQGQSLPTAGAKVLISAGNTVQFDSILVTALHTVRIDGALEFAPHLDTQLLADTIVVDVNGALRVGTPARPIHGGVAARIVIADTGPIDTNWDPTLVSRGLISHGELTMHGQSVTPYAALAIAPLAGDRVLQLAEVPVNWRVGDRIVLTGVSTSRNEDEEREILAIAGSRVTVAPLSYHHRPPAGYGQSVYVANMNRNVVVMSQNVAQNSRRGHVMAMHSNHVQVHNVGLYGLGRTDKRNPVNDPVLDKDGKLIDRTGLNPRGRYAFHVHRAGVAPGGSPAVVTGSAVVDSPGWGFVNHDSNAVMERNVAFHVVGSAFVTEFGNEIGAFRHNLAIRSTGSGAGIESRQDIFDFAHGGHGFWMQGPGVEVVGNIASGHTAGAFVFFTASSKAQFDAANLDDPALAGGRTKVPVGSVPLKKVQNNVAFASSRGLETWFHLTHMNDGQTVIENFTSWNTSGNGVFTPYTGRTTLKDVTLIGNPARPRGTGFGRNDVTNNMTYENVRVDGFEVGISVPVKRATVINHGRFSAVRAIEVRGAQDTIRTVDINGAPVFDTLTATQLQGRQQFDIYLSGTIDLKNRDLETFFSPDIVRLGTIRFQDRQVYYLKQAANAIPFPSSTSPTWMPPEVLDKTNLELWNLYGIAPAGTVAPVEAVPVERINGLVGPRTVYQPELRLVSRKYTNQLNDYQLAYRTPGGDTILDPQRVNLREGWNLVTRPIDGRPRTFFVYGDTQAPTFTASTPLVVNPAGLEFGFVLRGTVFDDSFGEMGFSKAFDDLKQRPVVTRADGSQFIRLEFQIRDLAGNTTNVVLELNLDPNAPLVPGTGQRDLPPRELPVTLLELLSYYYLTGQLDRLGDI